MYLESGCGSILVPHVSTFSQAQQVIKFSRYPPLGERGLSPYTNCHNYTHIGLDSSIKRHSKNTFVGILVEGKNGINNLKDIVETKGLDMVYLGLYDISLSVGQPGKFDHPDVKRAIDKCKSIIVDSGVFAGIFTRDKEGLNFAKSNGFNFIAHGADSMALKSFFDSVLS